MKTLKYQVTETFSNDTTNLLETFETEKEAKNFFAEQLQEDGTKPIDLTSCELELNKISIDSDGDEDIETVKSQTLYQEGSIDRNNNKSKFPIEYGFISFWNAKKKELEYTFYFQGEKERGIVLGSELENWFF